MAYDFQARLFLENGPAIKAAEARARRARAEAFYLAEASKLAAARKVIGTELKFAA